MSIGRDPNEGGYEPGPLRDPDYPPLPNRREEYELEDWLWRQTVPSSELTGARSETIVGNFANQSILNNSLRRDQVAELVVLEVFQSSCYLMEEGSSGTEPGTAYAEATMAKNDAGDAPAPQDFGDGVYFGNNDSLISTVVATAGMGFNDTAAGTGGGSSGWGGTAYYRMNFPELFGTGPLFFHDDEIQLSGNIKSHGNDTQDIRARFGWKTYWAVHDAGDIDEGLGLPPEFANLD